jgi:hypothetical protein
MNALERAERAIRSGIRETNGKNRSPEIDTIVRRFGGAYGAPYCAYGASYCFYSAKRELEEAGDKIEDLATFPYSGGSQVIRAAYQERGRLFTDPQELLRVKGALFGWTNEDGIHGHIGFVRQRFTANGKVTAIGTAEFNTSMRSKDRDGEGAYCLRRSIEELKRTHPRFWFCDTTDTIGGSWWQ